MKRMADIEKEVQLLEGILPNAWGTIGPHFVSSMEALAQYYGVQYGLSVYSADVALETILRGFGIGFGDEVIIADFSDPIDTFVTANVGAVPVYCDISEETLTVNSTYIAAAKTERTRAVIVDLPAGNGCDAREIADYCKDNGIYFILNMGDAVGTKQGDCSVAKYADAAFVDFREGTAMNIGLAGGLVTDKKEYLDLFYAYHNCGRTYGVGATISFDQILGGDFRIDEFQACLIPQRLKQAEQILAERMMERAGITEKAQGLFTPVVSLENTVSSCSGTLLRFCDDNEKGYTMEQAVRILTEKGADIVRRYYVMHTQPVLKDSYFIKMTGSDRKYEDEVYPNSTKAGKTVIYVRPKTMIS